jgi:hypothetical protein
MTYSPEGMLRIDFHHSSLFGALQEDATLVIRDSLIIYDRETRRLFGADSSLAMLRGSVGAQIVPDDIIDALLLSVPLCRDLESPRYTKSGKGWKLEALWRGRRVEWVGDEETGLRTQRHCFAGGKPCYVIDYTYGAAAGGMNYPKRIRLMREGGSESIAMEISDIEKIAPDRSAFDVEGVVAP